MRPGICPIRKEHSYFTTLFTPLFRSANALSFDSIAVDSRRDKVGPGLQHQHHLKAC